MAPKQREPVTYYGLAGVGRRFFGHADGKRVAQWMRRHPGCPQPDALFEPGRRGPEPGWLPERQGEFEDWASSFPGQGWRGAQGQRAAKPSRPAGPRHRDPVRYVGPSVVGGWFGFSGQTVSAWLTRYDDCPVEAARLDHGDGTWSSYYLPSQEQQWKTWDEGRPGRGAPGVPRVPARRSRDS